MQRTLFCSFTILQIASKLFGQPTPDTPPWRLLRATEAEQVEAVQRAVHQGLPPDAVDTIALLLRANGHLVIPIIENKIEAVVAGSCPSPCFANESVNGDEFAMRAASIIAGTGGEPAIEAVGKLVTMDEHRFGFLLV